MGILKVNPVTLTSYGQAPVGLEGSGACGAVGIGTGAEWCFPVFPKVDTPLRA